MWYLRITKRATSSIFKNFTYKNHPTLNQKACFSSHVSLKSPSSSSKYGYTNYPKNLHLVVSLKSPSISSKYGYTNYPKNLHLAVSLKSPSISSKYGYTNYPKNLHLVKHYHSSGGADKWYTYILGTYLLIGLVAVNVYFHIEKIPYTNRTHIVFAPPFWEKTMGDGLLEREQWGILSEEHPDSVRVKMIGEQIVEALESDLKAMNNQIVRTDHLRGFIWEFVVVDDPTFEASSLAGGKIFLSTAFLKKFESDAEIATAIGHEVGHAVARHLANNFNMWFLVSTTKAFFGLAESKMKIIDYNPQGVSKWIRVLFQYPNWRRQEFEADDIGLLVMASAGYDPQAAPKVYEKYDDLTSPEGDFFDMHPSGKKRAKKLARGKVMKEASSIYLKVIETRKMNDLKDR